MNCSRNLYSLNMTSKPYYITLMSCCLLLNFKSQFIVIGFLNGPERVEIHKEPPLLGRKPTVKILKENKQRFQGEGSTGRGVTTGNGRESPTNALEFYRKCQNPSCLFNLETTRSKIKKVCFSEQFHVQPIKRLPPLFCYKW